MSTVLTALAMLLQATSAGCDVAAERPLFECDQPLAFVLELPMKTLLRNADDRPLLDGRLYLTDADGKQRSLDVRVTTRGHSRLAICSFPPLSVLFHPAQVQGTVFAGQDKLKIVTQCRRGARYLDYLRQEYGIYRAFGVLADVAFRVRLLDITFRDAAGRREDDMEVAFFIESDDEVAARTGLHAVKQQRIDAGQLDPRSANVYELFQFMIANTDWSLLKGPGDEDCCHNGKVLAQPGADTGWIVLPYDFDQAGLIGTPYALPDERLGIRSVRQRLYRGRCEYARYLDDTIELFNARRRALEEALAAGEPSGRTQRSQVDYLDQFYAIVNTPKRLEHDVIAQCRGPRNP